MLEFVHLFLTSQAKIEPADVVISEVRIVRIPMPSGMQCW